MDNKSSKEKAAVKSGSNKKEASKTKKMLLLFVTMLKVGLFTFGGGFAMIALLEDEFVTKKKWINKDDFLDMIAITGSAPGSVGINAASFMGYRIGGMPGALISMLGACIPSFTIIYVISLFFYKFLKLKIVYNAFRGIQICVIYLILSAGINMLSSIKKNAFSITVIVSTVVCMVLLSLLSVSFSTIFYILISGILGLCIYAVGKLRKEKNK